MFDLILSSIRKCFARKDTAPPLAPEALPTLITTERFILRELAEADFEAVHSYMSDPMVVRYLGYEEPLYAEQTRAVIANARKQQHRKSRAYFLLAIVLRNEGILIGNGTLELLFTDNGLLSPADAATIGYVLHKDHWGQGFATEVARALLRFAFTNMNLACAYDGCLPKNGAARRVLEKAGMTLQGSQVDFPGGPLGVESLVFYVERDAWLLANGTDG